MHVSARLSCIFILRNVLAAADDLLIDLQIGYSLFRAPISEFETAKWKKKQSPLMRENKRQR